MGEWIVESELMTWMGSLKLLVVNSVIVGPVQEMAPERLAKIVKIDENLRRFGTEKTLFSPLDHNLLRSKQAKHVASGHLLLRLAQLSYTS